MNTLVFRFSQLSVSLCLSLCVSVPVSLSLSVSVPVSVSLSVAICLSVRLSVCLPLSLCFMHTFSFIHSCFIYVYMCVCMCLSVCLSVSVCLCFVLFCFVLFILFPDRNRVSLDLLYSFCEIKLIPKHKKRIFESQNSIKSKLYIFNYFSNLRSEKVDD